MSPDGDIETIPELMWAVQDIITGGYYVDIDVLGRGEHGFLVISVRSNQPGGYGADVEGDWWFDADGKVVQVL